MSPAAYLALLATARPLYVWLYRDAVDILPPLDPHATAVYQRLESHTGLVGVCKALGWGRDVVRREMARLVNYGWVQGGRVPRLLGHREGRQLYLLADVAAEQTTGDLCVVSSEILQVVALPEMPKKCERQTGGLGNRGTNRIWQGSTDEVWGDGGGKR